MQFPPFLLAGAVCVFTLAGSQIMIPTVKAQTPSVPDFRVRVEWQKAERGVSGLVMRGRIVNTGSKALTYTQVSPTLCDGAGKIVYTGSGYLTVSPLCPGQAAEFRACATHAPRFRSLHVALREAGQMVIVEEAP